MSGHIPRLRYNTPWMTEVEDVEGYVPGGYHPVCIGDSFMDGQYKVLHKLGAGGSSTVWLARDRDAQPGGGLVTLKILRADISATPPEELRDLVIPHLLHTRATRHPGLHSIQTVLDHFLVGGPNGSHRIIVHPFAALTVSAMSTLPDRERGARRLRANLARDVAKQVATAVQCMHDTGVVHGDITVSNIFFRASEQVAHWSNAEVYKRLGQPIEEELRGWEGIPPGPYAPPVVVQFIDDTRLQDPQIIRPEIVLSDFDRSYELHNSPKDYKPGTAVHYFPPELHFENRVGLEADIWCLGLAIFEIRAGFPLFEECMGSRPIHLQMMVETLGKLPDKWWAQYEHRHRYFEEDGKPKSEEERKRARCLSCLIDPPLRDKLRAIGANDTYIENPDSPGIPPPVWDQGPMCEKVGVTPSEEELALLGDLLEKMLAYVPEDRPTIAQVLEHPWFNYES